MTDIQERNPVGSTGPRWPWIIAPAAGALWAILQLRHSYFFYDEWSMIDRVLHMPAGAGMMASFNGHLWMLQYWLYWIQVSWFGVNDHVFICVVFVASLVTLHLSIAALLRASGLSAVSSLLIGGLLTYLGVASQNFIFAIQTSSTLSLAGGMAAAAIALARPPSPFRCVLAGALMLVSVGLDSGTALVGNALAAAVLVLTWRRAGALAALPSALALGWWFVAGDLGPDFPAALPARAAFAGRLLLTALGGLIGQGDIAGAVLLLLSVAVVTVGFRGQHITAPSRTMLVAGTIATAVAVAGLAQSRAGLPGFNFVDFNRYLQTVAIPATLALVPAWSAMTLALVARAPRLEKSRVVACVAPALVAIAFVLGLTPMRFYAKMFESMNMATRRGVQSAATVIRDGCPSGARPDPSSTPLGDLGPQLSTQLVGELMQRGALDAPSSTQPDPAVVDRMCSQ